MDLSLIYNDPAHQMLAQRSGMDMQAYVANMDPRALKINIDNLSRGSAIYSTQEQVNNLHRVGANSGANALISEAGSPMTAGMLSSPVQPQDPMVAPGVLNVPSASSPVQLGATPAALSQPSQGGMLPVHGGAEFRASDYPSYTNDNRNLGGMNDFIAGVDARVEGGNARSQALLDRPYDRAMGAMSATEDGRPVPIAAADADRAIAAADADRAMGALAATEAGRPVPTAAADAVLTSGGTAATPGALTSGGTATSSPRPNSGTSSGARQTPTNNTGNARQSGMPDMRIGRMAQLGRIGTAMLGSAGDGLLASMSAGGDAMYAVNDENRAAEMAEYENSERLRLEEAQRRAAAARGGGGGGGSGDSGGPNNVAGGGIYQQATLTALDAIQGYIDKDNGSMNPWNSINGFTGNLFSAAPGTPAHDVAGLLRTVEGAIGFDRLQAMREASRTGGALGAISERELALLSSSLASLRQSASAPEFQRNITLVRQHYQSAVTALNAQLAADAGQAPSGQAPSGQAPTATTTAFNPDDYTVVETTE